MKNTGKPSVLQNLRYGLQTARRLGQTSLVLQKAGWQWLRHRDTPVPELALQMVESLGSTYVKLGQLVASSPSLFPHEYVMAFQRCLDQTSPLPYAQIEKVLKKELGNKLRTHLREIDPKPLASASIAQVHTARLINGTDVVLKVQRPGIDLTIATDFRFMEFSSWLIERLAPSIPKGALTDMVEEIRNGMLEECDFIREAENIRLYNQFLVANNNTMVRVPKVYPELSTHKVLVMERFRGAPLANIDSVKKYAAHPEDILLHALRTWFLSLTQCQIYHADLHAGNVMILDDGTIGFIDFGIVGRIPEKIWNAMLSLGISVPAKDFHAIAAALCTIGATNQDINTAQFARDLEQLYLDFTADPMQSGNPEDLMHDVTMKISTLSRRHGIRFPREFTLLVKQFLYFDRYIQLLAPDIDIFEQAALHNTFTQHPAPHQH